ncbi:MAG: hypothetical protein Q9197_006044, partial [Variospora fuerteventurae]
HNYTSPSEVDSCIAAEWLFQYLRRNAQIARERLIEHGVDRSNYDEDHAVPEVMGKGHEIFAFGNVFVGGPPDERGKWHAASPTTGVHDETDIKAYLGSSQGVIGWVIIYSGGIWFLRSVKRKEISRRSFLEFVEMRKTEDSLKSKLPAISAHSLELKFIHGDKLRPAMAVTAIQDQDIPLLEQGPCLIGGWYLIPRSRQACSQRGTERHRCQRGVSACLANLES